MITAIAPPDNLLTLDTAHGADAQKTAGASDFEESLTRASGHTAQKRDTQGKSRATSANRDVHELPTATDLAVTELQTHGPTKVSVAAATARQTAASSSEPSDSGQAAPTPTQETRVESQGRAARSPSASAQPRHTGTPTSPREQVTQPESCPSAPAASNHQQHPENNARDDAGPSQAMIQTTPAAAQAPTAAILHAAPSAPPAATASQAKPAQQVQGISGTATARRTDATTRPSAPSPQPASNSKADKLLAQVSRALAAALRQNGGTVTLRLKPEELGDLKVRLQLQDGRVDARFEVRTDRARELLDKSIGALRSALEAHGLTIDRLSIRALPADSAPAPHHDTRDHSPGSGPGFANHQPAGGDTGHHGWTGAESAEDDSVGQASRLPGSRDGCPADHTAETAEEMNPFDAGIGADGAPGGAPNPSVGLDALA